MKQTIAIAVSGGIDSLAAAHILKKEHPHSFCIHFTTGYEKHPLDFSVMENQLGIPIKHVDLSTVFETEVVDYFITSYLAGKTPNPCLICNKTIKFGALFRAAQELGADRLATGHYARIKKDDKGNPVLLKGRDSHKDQSYFLSMLSKNQLNKAMFPLGEMTKPQVRQYAAKNNLVPSDKKESQDICFIQEKSFSDFILSKKRLLPGPGDIVTTTGKVIGKHNGLFQFTIGQRRGINCPGPAPFYVKSIDMKENRLIVGFKKELLQKSLVLEEINYITGTITKPEELFVKIRYSHNGALATLTPGSTTVSITFHKPQYAVTPGQGCVLYNEDRVVGAGIIQ